MYLNARYISASEDFGRFHDFPKHFRKPPMEKLPCYLRGDQRVTLKEGETQKALLNSTSNLEAFLNCSVDSLLELCSTRKLETKKRKMLSHNTIKPHEGGRFTTFGRIPNNFPESTR